MSRCIDLTGQKFGKLIALKRVENSKNGQARWLCKCECGNEVIVQSNHLNNGNIKSCGCIKHNSYNKKYNRYDLSGEYGIGYTSKGEEFYFDLEDYDKIKDYCWFIDSNGYVVSNKSRCKQKHISMHRLLFPNAEDVDHKYGENTRNDNRKNNLRPCTHQNNIFNCKVPKNNTSGVTGVSWNKNMNKWQSYIMVNYRKINLGYFSNFDNAVKARKEAEDKYFGEFSYNNSQKKVGGLNG